MPARQIVVTLTAIPPRYQNLPRKLASLARQSHRPDAIELHIPRQYRRFPGEKPSLPSLPDFVTVVEDDVDYGPASKVLPAAARWKGTNTDLLICDDDRIQDRGWVARFVQGRKDRPDDIVCERGWNIADRFAITRKAPEQPRAELAADRGRTPGYRLRRIASLNLWHPPRKIYASSGYADIFEGFLGALIPVDTFPPATWDIPPVVWTVDDVWLSGMAYSAGTKTWVNGLPRPVYANSYFDKVASLTDHVEQGVGREDADRLAVDYLRNCWGVWP